MYLLGIKNQLQKLIVKYDKWEQIKVFPISLNIDGMSPFNSSSKSLWPILLSINIRPYQVCTIVITYGKSKPTDNEFINETVDELNIVTESGILINGNHIKIKLEYIICDAPARAMVKNIFVHNSKKGCERFHVRGEYYNNRMIFEDINYVKRTHEEFKMQSDILHHKGVSILLKLKHFDIINQIPLDYMHLICIGVMKKLIKIWIEMKFLSSATIQMRKIMRPR